MTSVIQPMSPASSLTIITQPIIAPNTMNSPPPTDDTNKSTSANKKIIPASPEQITSYYIKKLIEKQQPLDQSYKQHLLATASDEEKEIIETIETTKTRYKLLSSSLEFKNRRLLWQALCQSHPQDDHVVFFDTNSSVILNPEIEAIDSEYSDSILRIASVYAIEHTYHQGMAYLIEPFVSMMPENEAYSVFVRFLELHDIPTSIYQQMEDRLHDIEIMLKHTCPDLLFEDVRCTVESWLQGTCRIPVSLMDIILLEGYTETLLRFIVARLVDSDCPSSAVFEIRLPKRRKPIDSVPLLQQQIEDLIRSMSQLQKEHDTVIQENTQLKMKEMDDEQTQTKLIKRNAVLEKRLKKYKTKLASATASAVAEEEQPPIDTKKKKHESFVESLRETGDFGALIAGALSPPPAPHVEQIVQPDVALQNVTSELVSVKLALFETQQNYEQMRQQLEENVKQQQALHEQALEKSIYLQNELEDMQMERDQLIGEQEEVIEMAMVAKKTSTELQMEKLQLGKQVDKLLQHIKDLEQEKQNYFMPRDTFSEEVFAAHSILFGNKNKTKNVEEHESDEYKTKYVESELRCRELEKYLAETKVKLAELESSYMATPRTSYQPSRRTSMITNKRNSTASMLRMTTERRESSESFSTTSSIHSYNTNSKRSSALYSRIWSAFGTPKPLEDEPQIIEQP